MADLSAELRAANDRPHVLPLAILPLKSRAFDEASLIKNTQLEGVVEVFSDDATGNGQIAPRALPQYFDLSGDRAQDHEIIQALADLPSYDVFSLRIELRELGIDVEHDESLRLSAEMERQLSDYMQVFTRPLMTEVFGVGCVKENGFSGIIQVLQNPDVGDARRNLMALADKLEVGVQAIPLFLMRYGDVYLSLAYYSYYMDRIRPPLWQFLSALERLRGEAKRRCDVRLVEVCSTLKERLSSLEIGVSQVLEYFRIQTEDMWQCITASRFKAMEALILEYQRKIGGSVCALTVKMDGWAALKVKTHPTTLTNFVLSDMVQGLDRLHSIEFRDALV